MLAIIIATTSAAVAAFFYFRPPRITPCSRQAVNNVVRIAQRNERPLE